MTMLTNFPPELDPDTPVIRAKQWSPKKATVSPSVETVSIPAAQLQEILSAIDKANAILTHQEERANQLEEVANSLMGLAKKIRHQAKGIRDNRERLNAVLYPVTAELRVLGKSTSDLVH